MVSPPMAFLAFLADRPPQTALPALVDLHADLKLEALAVSSLAHLLELEPEAVLVDAAENPGQAWAVLQELHGRGPRVHSS